MNTSTLDQDTADNARVTRAHVNARAHELALLAGRPAGEVAQIDYLQAKRELTGEAYADLQDAILDALPEEKRWDPVPGTPGHQTPESPNEDEDEEGRSEREQLVDLGIAKAEDDQSLAAAKAAARKNK